jgi:hypothetical protein
MSIAKESNALYKKQKGTIYVIIMPIAQLDIKQHKSTFEGTIVLNRYDIIDNGNSIKFFNVLNNVSQF